MRKKDIQPSLELAKRLERSTRLYSGGEMAIVANTLQRQLEQLDADFAADLQKPRNNVVLREYDRCKATLKAFQHLQEAGGE